MSTTTYTPTQDEAQIEVTRRAHNKRRVGLGLGKVAPACPEIQQMGGADLKVLAGEDFQVPSFEAPAKASTRTTRSAVKTGKSKAVKAKDTTGHAALRRPAMGVKNAHWFATGENMTYTQACEALGTAPATPKTDEESARLAKAPTKAALGRASKAETDPIGFLLDRGIITEVQASTGQAAIEDKATANA